MRTIKFRGKDATTGKWVYGYYAHLKKNKNHECHCIMTEHQYDSPTFTPEEGFNIDEEMFITINPVNPETVGQFTGLFDANQKEIYEGDIIRLVTGYRRNHDGTFVEQAKEITVEYDLASFNICSFALVTDNIEVIGNIYDNPLTPSNPPTP